MGPSREPLLSAARAWLDADPDPNTRAELESLLEAATRPPDGDPAAWSELGERFAGRLAFGTAGLRGELGAGPMRMNRLVVRQAAAGLAAWLGPGHSVVVGFDARHQSDQFALDTARVLAAAGLTAHLFVTTCPTPVLAFAVRHLGADAGVMCTASHNPSRDNGYKVYLGDGAQIVPPVDARIAEAIERAARSTVPMAPAEDPAIARVGPEAIANYLDHVAAATVATGPRIGSGPPAPDPLRIAYTPLHGVGGTTARRALARAGFEQVGVVSEQFEPDPDFPTVPFPNPEEPGVLDLVAALARTTGADLVLANDPDADRLAVMVPAPDLRPADAAADPGADPESDWQALTGNQIGALLADHLLSVTTGADRLVVTTYVSSQLLSRQAEAAGVHYAEVATGFKWVVRPGLDHPELRFVFGYEEALGFSVDAGVRDKDGISAAVCFAQLVASARDRGETVWTRLDGLARRFGEHVTRTESWRAEGLAGRTRMDDTMDRLRRRPPTEVGGTAVQAWRDLARPGDGRQPSDAVIAELADGSRVCLRPSGTEPKLKAYVEVVEPVGPGPDGPARARRRGGVRADALVAAVGRDLLGPLTAASG